MPKKRDKILENRRSKKKPGYDVKDLTPANAHKVWMARKRYPGNKFDIEDHVAYR